MDSPSGNIGGVLASSATVGVADLEDGTDRATVLPGSALDADVVFSAVLGVSVPGEATGCAAHLTGRWACESIGDLCENIINNE